MIEYYCPICGLVYYLVKIFDTYTCGRCQAVLTEKN